MAALDHAPPPFFRRGTAPAAKMAFYVLASIALFVLDIRFHNLELLRKGISVVTDPVQQLAQSPIRALSAASRRFTEAQAIQTENVRLHQQVLEASPTQLRLDSLQQENERLRKLLSLQEREDSKGQVASILYTPRDPYSRRVVVDKGITNGIAAGQPVIDDLGIVGQVTRTYPLSAEITLITDKEQAVPIHVLRNGLRSIVSGLGNGLLELKFLPVNADVQEGDVLVTSGLDGVYLAGFPVAKVIKIDKDTESSFARIICAPLAKVENFGEVLILNPRKPLPEPPNTGNETVEKSERRGRAQKKA